VNLTPQDDAKRLNSPPLQGRGRGWGLSANTIAELHARACRMRNNPTEPEKRLWRHLSNSQLGGWKFRRQQVIGLSIADFVCASAKLAVEVDGDTHDTEADSIRDAGLGRRGYRVLRVTNDDVMRNADGVKIAILQALENADKPHPNPSPEGEGLDAAPPPSPSGEGLGVGSIRPEAQKLLGISHEGSVG